jgi:hypothetical protein
MQGVVLACFIKIRKLQVIKNDSKTRATLSRDILGGAFRG